MPLPYYIVDVFTSSPLGGNALAVVLEAGNLTTEQMQRIANEFNLSETTFVCDQLPAILPPAGDGGGGGVNSRRVRIFTPKIEMPFAGHPTLGTAHVLGGDIDLDLNVGKIPVRRSRTEPDSLSQSLLWMSLNPAEFLDVLDLNMLKQCLGGVEGLEGAQIVTCGSRKALCPVSNSAAVRAAVLDASLYTGPPVTGLYVFTTNPDDIAGVNVHGRFFCAICWCS